MKKNILIIVFMLCFVFVQAYNKKIDSLKAEINNAENDSVLIDIYTQIAIKYMDLASDSALIWYDKAIELTKKNEKYQFYYAKVLRNKSWFLINVLSELDSAKILLNRALDVFKNEAKFQKDKNKTIAKEIGHVYHNLGIISYYKGDYALSKQNIIKNIKISISINDFKQINDSYNLLGLIYQAQGISDSAMYYYQKILNSKIDKNKKLMLSVIKNIGIVHYYQSKYDSALFYYKKALKLSLEDNKRNSISDCYNAMGLIYQSMGAYQLSIQNLLKSLKIKEELDDKIGVSAALMNIGIVNYNQKNYDKALDYFFNSLEIKEKLGYKKGIANCYNNIGLTYIYKNNIELALKYYYKSLEINQDLNDKFSISGNYQNIADALYESKKYAKAIDYCLKSIKIKEEIEHVNGLIESYRLMSKLYKNKGGKDNLLQSLNYANKAYNYSKQIQALQSQKDLVEILVEINMQLGKFNKSIQFFKIYLALQDSLFDEQKTKALVDVEIKYKTEKKELQIEKMEQQKALDDKIIEIQEERNRKQQIALIASIIGVLLVFILAIVLYKMFNNKKRNNKMLSEQNEEIKQQRDEIQIQRDKVIEQKIQIEKIHYELTYSIDYAEKIQQAVLPSQELFKTTFKEHFVLFKPHSVVSGDFYWIYKYEKWVYIAVVDCTGHGVPGALMSMVGISFLNEIIKKKAMLNASEVLNQLRALVIDSLKQKNKTEEPNISIPLTVKDGMDMAFCAIDMETDICHFAGANNPLYLVKSEKLKVKSEDEQKDSEFYKHFPFKLYELKGDKMPIAIYDRMETFTNHEIKLEKGDTLYMFTDGFADQFGGPKGKKLKYKPFKQLLLDNCNKPMNEQHAILNQFFEDWKGNKDQIDDVTVLGIRI